MTTKINIQTPILSQNDLQAQKLRTDFSQHQVYVLNFVSSPGSGKTELISKLSQLLISQNQQISVIVGDLATDNDAQRIKKSGAQVFQINTDGNCHLECSMIQKALDQLDWQNSDFLIIENVGNLVCPASFDLGENIRVVLMSVTEGEDKPLKYPTMFNSSNLCILTKIDLAQVCEFNLELAIANIHKINPDIKIVTCSAKSNEGLKELKNLLIELKNQQYNT